MVAYTKQTWTDLVTEANAVTMTHIENGIFAAQNAADAAQSTATTAVTTANQAATTATGAQTTANAAQTAANTALTAAQTPITYAALPDGMTITIDKTKFGGIWPSTRPTTDGTACVVYTGDTDPGAISIDGDKWDQ